MYWRLLAGPVSNKSFLQRSTVFTFWTEPAPFSPVRRSFNKAPVRVCIQLYKLRPSDSTHLDLGGESSTIVLNPLFCFKNIDSKDQFKQKNLDVCELGAFGKDRGWVNFLHKLFFFLTIHQVVWASCSESRGVIDAKSRVGIQCIHSLHGCGPAIVAL